MTDQQVVQHSSFPPTASPREGASDPRRRVGSARLLGYFLAFVLLAVLWTAPAWLDPTARLVGGPNISDAPEQAWQLSWVPYSIVHGLNPFYTHAFDYPKGANLLWPGAPFLIALLVSPVTAALGPVVAYNAAIVVAISSAAFSGYICCSRWVSRQSAAIVGGAAFGFSPFVTGQASGHILYVAVALVPIILLTLDELIVRDRWSQRRTGLVLGSLALGQLLTAEEVLVDVSVAALVGLAWLVVLHPRAARARVGRTLAGLGWATAVFMPGAAYPIWFQFFGPGAIHGHLVNGAAFSANLVELVVPGYHQAVTSPMTAHLITQLQGHSGEVGAYLGIPMIVLLIGLSRRRSDGPSRFFCIMAASIAVLALGPVLRVGPVNTHIPLPEALVDHVPGLGNLLPIRLSDALDLFVALALSLYLDLLSRRPEHRWRRILALLAAASWLPTVTAPVIAVPVPRFFGSAAADTGPVLLVLPVAENADSDIAMLWQAASGMRFAMPEGYYPIPAIGAAQTQLGPSFTPLTGALTNILLGDRPEPVTMPLRRSADAYLRVHHVCAIVAGPEAHWHRAITFMTAVVGASPVAVAGVDVWELREPGLSAASPRSCDSLVRGSRKPHE